jgi:hypothetical protein
MKNANENFNVHAIRERLPLGSMVKIAETLELPLMNVSRALNGKATREFNKILLEALKIIEAEDKIIEQAKSKAKSLHLH